MIGAILHPAFSRETLLMLISGVRDSSTLVGVQRCALYSESLWSL